ncbi:MAG TPA: AMP-dependent synthetase/ligase, partial [Pirellulales bacterium]
MDAKSLTLVKLFQNAVARGGDRPALHVPIAGSDAFQALTWNDLAQEVRRLAAGFRRAGVQPGDRVAQISENRYEWIVVDLAVHMARGVHVAVHSVLSAQQIAYQIADSEAKIVLLSTNEQVQKMAGAADRLPRGLQYYSYDASETEIAGQPVLPFTELFVAPGKEAALELEQESLKQTKPDDLATILYTSGTTGEAKGVMLSHRNLATNAQASCDAFETAIDDLRLTWLPLSHIFARTCDLYTWLIRGSQLALAESREKIIAHCAVLKPTLMNGVPYFFEKVCRGLQAAGKVGPIDATGGANQGSDNQAGQGGQTHLQRLLGGNMRACCSGGAALPDHVAEFFWREGVPLVQGYGLTESSPVITTCTPHKFKLGTVGPAVDGVEVRIADDGEVLTRGPHVMLGYWKRSEETVEAIRDGWLHTGDLGSLDAEGYLRITGRKKELIVTAGGKNIAPVFLENLLASEPLVHQVMIVGEGRR